MTLYNYGHIDIAKLKKIIEQRKDCEHAIIEVSDLASMNFSMQTIWKSNAAAPPKIARR